MAYLAKQVSFQLVNRKVDPHGKMGIGFHQSYFQLNKNFHSLQTSKRDKFGQDESHMTDFT